MSRMPRIIFCAAAPFALCVSLVLAACNGSPTTVSTAAAGTPAAPGSPACPTGTAAMDRYEVYFGGSISDADWQRFVDMEVTPRFPRGFTVVDAHGQWQESNGQISKEGTRILIVVVPNNLTAAAYMGAIATAYNDQFDQDNSLMVRASVCAGFVTGTPD